MAESNVRQLLQTALQQHQSGKLGEAEQIYRQILSIQPNQADALRHLGLAMLQMNRPAEAIELLQVSLAVNSRIPSTHNNLGEAFRAMRRMQEAVACYRDALVIDPAYPEAHNNLGAALQALKETDEAIEEFQTAINLRPNYANAHRNLGTVLLEVGRADEAIAPLRKAAAARSDDASALATLGDALVAAGPETLAEGIDAYRRVVQIDPKHADAHKNLGIALLQSGRWGEGFEEYEWRFRAPSFTSPMREFAQPVWNGEDLAGKTILVHAEQGFGDTIQFARYAPLVKERGGRVLLECPAELLGVFETVAGVDEVVKSGATLPAFDVHVALLSLGRIFGTTIENVPSAPYLSADPERVARWKQRIASPQDSAIISLTGDIYASAAENADQAQFRVGLVWFGNPRVRTNVNRSCGLEHLVRLAHVQGVSFHSLQKGPRAADVYQPSVAALRMRDYSLELRDFAETAALIANLDLVIGVDTSVVHLAGAMGKPAWTLLSYMPDWRWLLEREDSPWYPSMRLFRQERRGDWQGVVDRVVEELAKKGQV